MNRSEKLNQEVTFEEAMEKLERIVEQLEAGEIPLEEAIQLFQEGMELSRLCHQKLERVEHKIQLLMDDNGELVKKQLNVEEAPS
jgi:exodeoxyribonuclease VII small subunit